MRLFDRPRVDFEYDGETGTDVAFDRWYEQQEPQDPEYLQGFSITATNRHYPEALLRALGGEPQVHER